MRSARNRHSGKRAHRFKPISTHLAQGINDFLGIKIDVDDMRAIQANVALHTNLASSWTKTDPLICDVSGLATHIGSLERIMEDLRRLEFDLDPPFFEQQRLLIQNALEDLERVQSSMGDELLGPDLYVEPQWEKGPNGYLRRVMDAKELREQFSSGMTDKEMALYFQVCRQTVADRRESIGLFRSKKGFHMDDDTLAAHIRRAWSLSDPNAGWRVILGQLRSLKVPAPRDRVRKLVAKGHASTSRMRFFRTCVRRVYRVHWINGLWHMDGHHKLIDYKIVIHGCIDGHSRCIVYLKAADNNQADSVVEFFKDGAKRLGLPSRVRGDYGGENLEVKALMEEQRGKGRGSFIQGPSTRNNRIERLWVDLQEKCTNRYKKLFGKLEQEGLLYLDNPLDLWCLHFCFLPQLNEALQHMVEWWDLHPVDSKVAGQRTPLRMWTQKMDEHDPHVQEQAEMSFAQFGLDDYGRRASGQPKKESDPYIVVSRVLEDVDEELVMALEQPQFRDWLAEQLGPCWPPREDMGKARYQLCRRIIDGYVRMHFPHIAVPRS